MDAKKIEEKMDEVDERHRTEGLDDDILESDVDLDNTEVVEPDNDPPMKMGDPSNEVTEESLEAAQVSKSKALAAISDGKLDEAIDHLTEAIMLNPKSAILYASRAGVFVKLKKPNAAIRDATTALLINPESAKGYKALGMARALLGLWEQSARALRVASRLDFDEDIAVVLKKVESNANKIEEHRRKYELVGKERELRKTELEKQKPLVKSEDAEAAVVVKDGEVIGIHSITELKSKLTAASKASQLTVMYFTATWCGPCRYIGPIVSSLAQKYPKVVFLKLDIDEASDAAMEWNVSSVPSFFFVKNGKEVDQVVGGNKNALEQKIAKHSG